MNSRDLIFTNSTLQTLQGCGEKFRRRYIEREYRPSRPRLVRGSAVHHVARTAMRQKLDLGTLPTRAEIRNIAAESFEAAWTKDDVRLEPSEVGLGVDAVRGYQKDLVVDLATLYLDKPAPTIMPIAVERQIELHPKDMDITIRGTIDLIEQLGDGEGIRDEKTSEQAPKSAAADESEQLSLYALLRFAETKRLPDRVMLDHLYRTPKQRDLKHVPQISTRDAEDIRMVVERLNAGVRAVEAGVFMPISSEHWSCSPTWCEFWDDCVFTRRGERRPTS